MAYKWGTPASVWLEDETSGQFALASSAGLSRIDWQAQARSRLPDVAQLLGAALPQGCQCSAIYPEGFAFCPRCGHRLRAAAPSDDRADWWGPYVDAQLPRHVPHGLPVTALPLADVIETRAAPPALGRFERSLPTPPNAQCVFAAARYGFPVQRLLALAYTRNVLQYWDPNAELWHVMAAEEGAASLAFSASDYGWLPARVARRGEVGLVPTERGLVRLFVNPVSESYRTETVLDAALASAPGALRRHVACLYLADSGTRLWSQDSDSGEVADVDCGGIEVPAAGWSRPFAYDGKLSWLHEHGQLSWQPGGTPLWLPWPQPWSPRLAFGGPTQSRDGSLWQIGHDGQGYSLLELGVPNGRMEPLNGARLGFSTLLFRRGHAVIGEPWEAEHVEDPHEDDAMVLPLLRAYNNDRGRPSGLVLRFHKYTGTAEAALAAAVIPRTTLEWIGARNVVLDEIMRLARPRECVPFVYDGCLWLHHPDWNQIRGYRLEART